MPLVTVGHPIPGLTANERIGRLSLAFVGGRTGQVTVTSAQQSQLVSLGYVINPAVPNYESPYVLDAELADPESSPSLALRAAFRSLVLDMVEDGEIGSTGGGGGLRRARAAVVEEFGEDVGTGGDDTAALQAAIDYGIANKVPVVAAGNYLSSAELVAVADSFVLVGHSPKGSSIRRTTPGNVLTVRAATADQGDTGAGAVRDILLSGSTPRPEDGSVALLLDAMRGFDVYNVIADNADIGFDAINNCYKSGWSKCRVIGDRVNVGILLRGSRPDGLGAIAGSGSDNFMLDNWVGATKAAIWMEPNAGGYHIHGGQAGGGNQLAAVSDQYGSITTGIFYQPTTTVTAAATIGATTLIVADAARVYPTGRLVIGTQQVTYTGRDLTTNTLTGVAGITAPIAAGAGVHPTGGVATVDLTGLSFEGTSKRHVIRSYDTLVAWTLTGCAAHGYGPNVPISFIKNGNPAGGGSVTLQNLKIEGDFSAPTLLDIVGSGTYLHEYRTVGVVNANGVRQDYSFRPMLSWGGCQHGVAHFLWQQYIRENGRGRYFRTNTGRYETTTSDVDQTWSAVGPTPSLTWNEVMDRFNRADAADLGATDTGQTWTANPGAWSISGNKAVSTSVDANANLSLALTGGRDVALDVALAPNSSITVVPVLVDEGNFIRVGVDRNSGQMFAHVAGVGTQIGFNFSAGLGAAGVGRLDIQYRENSVEVVINGTTVAQANLTVAQRAAMMAAPSGVRVRGAAVGTTFDNFVVRR